MYKKKHKYFIWNEKFAEKIAFKEGIILTTKHWEIIYLLRILYKKFNTVPNLRMLVISLNKKYGFLKFDSTYIFNLFPKGPIKQASKIAGLPKTNICL
ncbi:TusE/DsrC/DsvC family sulfur relay protein [Enterobacteriaceae endosymbiont of Plateumaris consimilis]|uniref:TusE/DsrC/DsvC family sulfur relay protein n=1 Tax=Enterobacteriaceae endosymbiont of Plateumaris consimilis TaxID=2675794 RepID=UPI001449EEF3|nr:TusE/DsrC/DsvC family sulfur relay protein [Enterobacteriaceae endosymbiont of Plateumaris consimilis]QJC28435.1 TusE/DsrC/DsvC family sulfur relay protein [Enterobacteriaceae endosymbiont of Plateumaris consimilis]